MLTAGRGIDGLDRLDVRLVALLGLALLPIGLIAMVQTYRVISEADRNAQAALTGATLSAATVERETLLRVRGGSQVASKLIPSLLDTPGLCSDYMSDFVEASENLTFAGFVNREGRVVCGSDGAGADVSGSKVFQDFRADPRPDISAVFGQVSGRNVLVVTEPVLIRGELAGYVALSVPHRSLSLPMDENLGLSPILSMTFTAAGRVLWAPDEDDALAAELPADQPLSAFAAAGPMTMTARSKSGRKRIYTVAPLVPGEIYALAVWPPNATRTSGLTAASAILFPLLMWLVSIGVAYFAVHRLVVRHIRYLRLRIRAFTANRRIMAPQYGPDTPSDLREVIEAFHQMTERIVRDEADLENNLHEKDVLLKEVHHRVKNNLQLIASMMNMQLRKAEEGETKFVLRRLQDRVLGLATIHRNLYQATVLSRVNSSKLIHELVAQSVRSADAEARAVDLRVDVDEVALYPDQAVPLSLLITETVTNALKYVGKPEDGPAWIELTLRTQPDGTVRLHVANSLGIPLGDESRFSTGLGTQLIQAFALQLDADATISEDDGQFTVEAAFRPSQFAEEQ